MKFFFFFSLMVCKLLFICNVTLIHCIHAFAEKKTKNKKLPSVFSCEYRFYAFSVYIYHGRDCYNGPDKADGTKSPYFVTTTTF